MPAGAARATKVPLRPITPTVSRSTNGNGNGNGKGKGKGHTRSHTIQNQTNAELGSTIVRSASAMSNASASSTNVMSPPYAVFHPPPVRKSGSDSGSDSDSDLESQKFMEKLLERASDTEGIGQNKDKGKGKGKEKERVVEEKRGAPPLQVVVETDRDNSETRPRQTPESSTSKDASSSSPAADSSSKPNSKPPSVKSDTSPKTSGQALSDTAATPVATNPQENANNRTGDNSQSDSTDAVNNLSETSAAPLAATQENTPTPVTSSRLHVSPSHSTVSTFSHDMLKSPQAGQRTPEPGETPRIGNGNGNGNGGHSSSGSASTTSLSLGAAGEAMQSMNIGTTAVKNGIQTIPPSAFGNVSATSSLKNPAAVVSSSTSRNSTVSMASLHPSSPSSSSTGGSGGSAPGSSSASPDSSPDVFQNGNIHSGGGGGLNSISSTNVNEQAHSTRTALNGGGSRGYSHGSHGHGHNHGGHSSASSSVSTTSEMFARATITRQSHPTNISYSNGVNHGHNAVNGNGNRDAGGLFGQDGRSTSSYVPAGYAPGSTPPSSLTRHTSLRRERERERERDREQRERESQRPIPSPVRASSARRSTVKMASVKTTSANSGANGNAGDVTAAKVNNNGDAEHVRSYARGHGHNRTVSDSSTISGVTPTQANFSSFHFNHFPGSSSSQSNNNNLATISALPTFQPPTTISMNPGKTSATTKLVRLVVRLFYRVELLIWGFDAFYRNDGFPR